MSNEDPDARDARKVHGPKALLFAMLSGFIIGFAWFFGTYIPPCIADGDFWDGINRALNVALGYLVYLPFMFILCGVVCIAAAVIVGIAVYFRKWPAGWQFGLMIFVVSTAIAVFVGENWSHVKECRIDFI